MIERSIRIDAPAGRVWEVLTSAGDIEDWAGAFMEGAQARGDWREGGEIEWLSNGQPMIRGRITTFEPGRALRVHFPRELNPDTPEGMEAFSEEYLITEDGDGVTLAIRCGPLADDDYNMLSAPWDDALSRIQRRSASRGSASRGEERLSASREDQIASDLRPDVVENMPHA
jgi:uncharacterized protein YndB with AHSA1/START domain